MSKFTVTRRIEIDAGHRVMTHGSKCRNLHGHRYVILATFSSSSLINKGVETGMVKDFGNLKQVLQTEVHTPCDHKLIVCIDDTALLKMLGVSVELSKKRLDTRGEYMCRYLGAESLIGDQLVIVDCIPTAENLACLWTNRISHRLNLSRIDSAPDFSVDYVDVFETPNCQARYYNV